MIAAPLSSGILSGDPNNTSYQYKPAPQEIIEKKTKIQKICDEHGVSLQQAALHFPLLQPAVKTVVMGAVNPKEIELAVKYMNNQTPSDLWKHLKIEGLLSIDLKERSTIMSKL